MCHAKKKVFALLSNHIFILFYFKSENGFPTLYFFWYQLSLFYSIHIHENAWNPEINAFVQSYGSSDLDASVLLMESYGFIHAKDPKFVSTVRAVEEDLSNDGLLYRYKNEDDFGLPSSSFTICTFWFINSLFKIGEEEKARS